jgi:hypothetical protein
MFMGSEGSSLISCTASHSSTLAVRSWPILIEVPLVPGPRTPATELIRVRLAEFAIPLADSFVSHLDTTFTEEFFPIPETQTEPKVQPDSVADDLYRKAMMLIYGGSRRCVHALITSY